VGLETVELAALNEPGLRRTEDHGDMLFRRMPVAMAASSPEPEFDVRPDDLEVSAEVTADFTAR
jgi:hypothetical protein